MKAQRTKLSENFYLDEFTHDLDQYNQTITSTQSDNLKRLINNILQPLRTRLRDTVDVSCGIRTLYSNKLAGGVYNSQHLTAEAVDIKCKLFNLAILFITVNCKFDQLIIYLNDDHSIRFLHISTTATRNRKQVIYKHYSSRG